ncbi:MAG TPA: hypothetical protein VGP06_18750 [Janthinobacterium sp.]|nr:hypothetical protein [Janthinobacterium sp.]
MAFLTASSINPLPLAGPRAGAGLPALAAPAAVVAPDPAAPATPLPVPPGQSVPAGASVFPGVPALLEEMAAAALFAPGGAAGLAGEANAGTTPGDTPAMQEDQLFLSRQVVWQAPDTGTLAASWRVMFKTYGEQRAAVLDMNSGQHLPSSLFMADQNPAQLRDSQRAPSALEAQSWRFVVYGWGGQKMLLRLLAGDDDEAPAEKRRRTKVALRLELVLPELGRMVIQMEPLGDAILLDLATPHAGAMLHLRAMLPELAGLVGRAGLRIARCRIGHELPAIRVDEDYPLRSAAATLPLALFKAMAEVALRLSQPPAQTALVPAA